MSEPAHDLIDTSRDLSFRKAGPVDHDDRQAKRARGVELGFGALAAGVSRANMRDAMMQSLLVSDPHSPTRARASVVRNLDAWYKAFNIHPGDALYLAPDQRVKLW